MGKGFWLGTRPRTWEASLHCVPDFRFVAEMSESILLESFAVTCFLVPFWPRLPEAHDLPRGLGAALSPRRALRGPSPVSPGHSAAS